MNGKKGKDIEMKTIAANNVVDVLPKLFKVLQDTLGGDHRFLFPRGIDGLKVGITVGVTKLELELRGPTFPLATGEFGHRARLQCQSDESEVTPLYGMTADQATDEAWQAGQFTLVDGDGNRIPRDARGKVKSHIHPQPGTCHPTGDSLGVELDGSHVPPHGVGSGKSDTNRSGTSGPRRGKKRRSP